jgi:uncharacterized protein (DUF1499 family)
MDKIEKIRMWVTRAAVGLAILIPLVYIAAPIGFRSGLWDLMTSFGILTKYGPNLLKITAGIAAIALALSIWLKHRNGIAIALMVLAVPIAGIVYNKSLKAQRKNIPPIHDISTDTENPPAFTSVILERRGENSNPVNYIGKTFGEAEELVSVAQVRAYPEVRTIVLAESPDAVFDKVVTIAQNMGWKLQSQSAATGIVEATDTTFWFRFKDDIVIRIRPSDGGGSLVDVRSISRIGRSDIGANAARIREFTQKLTN